MLGQATKLAMCLQIPSQASLHGMWKIEKNTGLRLVSKRGDVVKKHPQARLPVSFAKQLQHSLSELNP
jgi:hypothetical protein